MPLTPVDLRVHTSIPYRVKRRLFFELQTELGYSPMSGSVRCSSANSLLDAHATVLDRRSPSRQPVHYVSQHGLDDSLDRYKLRTSISLISGMECDSSSTIDCTSVLGRRDKASAF